MVKTPYSFWSSRLTHDVRCDVKMAMNDTHESKKRFFSTPFKRVIHIKFVEFTENVWI